MMSANPILAQYFGNVAYELHQPIPAPQNYSHLLQTKKEISVFESQRDNGTEDQVRSALRSRSKSSNDSSNQEKQSCSAVLSSYGNGKEENESSSDDFDGATGFSRFGSTPYRKIVQFVPVGNKHTAGEKLPDKGENNSPFTSHRRTENATNSEADLSAQRRINEYAFHSLESPTLPSSEDCMKQELSAMMFPQQIHPFKVAGEHGSSNSLCRGIPPAYTESYSTDSCRAMCESSGTLEGDTEWDEKKELETIGDNSDQQERRIEEPPDYDDHPSVAVPQGVRCGDPSFEVAGAWSPTEKGSEIPLTQLMMHSKGVLDDAKRLCQASRLHSSSVPLHVGSKSSQPLSSSPSPSFPPKATDKTVKEKWNHSRSDEVPLDSLAEKMAERRPDLSQTNSVNPQLDVSEYNTNAHRLPISSASRACSTAKIHPLRSSILSPFNSARERGESTHKEDPPQKILVSISDCPSELVALRAKRRWYPPALSLGTAEVGCPDNNTAANCSRNSQYQMVEVRANMPSKHSPSSAAVLSSQRKDDTVLLSSSSSSSSSASTNENSSRQRKAHSATPPAANALSVDSLVTIIEKLTTLLHPQPSSQGQVKLNGSVLQNKLHSERFPSSARRLVKYPHAPVGTPRENGGNSKHATTVPKSKHVSARSAKVLQVHTPKKLLSSNSAPTSPFPKSTLFLHKGTGRSQTSALITGCSTFGVSSKLCRRGRRTRRSASQVPLYALPTQNWLYKHSKEGEGSVGYYSSSSGVSSFTD